MRALFLLSSAAALASARAVSIPRAKATNERPVALSREEVDAFTPYLYYSAATYCPSSDLQTWSCGANCDANSVNFRVTAAGGNGADVQNWYVGYDAALDSVISTHQGTDLTHFEAILTDTKLLLGALPEKLYPGVPPEAKAHKGFIQQHAQTADAVLTAILDTLQQHNTTRVTFVGHSLGAGLALLESMSVASTLAVRGLTFKTVLFGLSRVGNEAFADWVDATLPDVAFVQNRNDLVAIMPGRFMGYKQISGEVHITDDGVWNRCSGQDNEADGCAIAATPNIFKADFVKHFGPYNGIGLGFCSMNA